MSDYGQIPPDIVFDANLRGRTMTFISTWGLFSPKRIDDGSRMLLEQIELSPDDVTLDVGCGYGAIGLPVARDCPDGRVEMVDKDFVAVAYARLNAERLGLDNTDIHLSNGFRHVRAETLDHVVSNLPANVGREMLERILAGARDRLQPGGSIWVVTVAGLRKFIRRNFETFFGNYEKVKQGKTYTVARARKR